MNERQKVEDEAEGAYRRGYWHGYSQGMDDLRDAYGPRAWKQSVNWRTSWQTVAKFFDEHLTRWRYARDLHLCEWPPVFAARAQGKDADSLATATKAQR